MMRAGVQVGSRRPECGIIPPTTAPSTGWTTWRKFGDHSMGLKFCILSLFTRLWTPVRTVVGGVVKALVAGGAWLAGGTVTEM